ncbi:hypothetical protein CVT26_004479, partial [Gymnopilus dilepis]
MQGSLPTYADLYNLLQHVRSGSPLEPGHIMGLEKLLEYMKIQPSSALAREFGTTISSPILDFGLPSPLSSLHSTPAPSTPCPSTPRPSTPRSVSMELTDSMTIGVSAYHETHDQLHNDQEIGDPEIPSLTTLADSQEKDVHSHEEGELSQSTSGCETSGSNHCEDGDHEQHERQGSATPSLEWPSAQQTSEGQQVDGLPGGSAQQTSEGQQVDGLPGGSALPGKRITRRQTLRKKTSAAQAAQAA